VGGIGPLAAPVCILGEALGKDEEQAGVPFIGAAGRFLWEGRDWTGQAKWEGLRAFGLPREDVRIENVIEIRPPDNALWKLTPATVARWQEECWRRIEKLNPMVVVPLGNLALNTLRRAPLPVTKKGKWRVRATPDGPQIAWRDKISNWRGSVFAVKTPNGERLKCIPTYHPAFILRAGNFFDAWRGDWERIRGDATFPSLQLDPRCEHVVNPTRGDAQDFQSDVARIWKREGREACLAVDIETVAKGHVIDCIGFSVKEGLSLTLDLRHQWAWAIARELLRHPIAKALHFGLYDLFVLWTKQVRVENVRWDTHQMHHCLDPRDQHRLAYCASRDLRVRFWKDEAKEEGKSTTIKDPKRRWKYNGKDVCYTRALVTRYQARLQAAGMMQVYRDHYRRLSAACLRLTQTGFAVDEDARRGIEEREQHVIAEIRENMARLAGTDLVAKKGLSPLKVNAYFYDTLKCQPFYRRGSGRRTADELAIRRLMRKYKKARPMGQLVLGYREHTKIAQEVRPGLVDDDGRIRSRYSPTTKTGRLHASKTLEDRGVNAQNRDRHSDLRRMFVADYGQVLLEFDQSQGESRIVDGMSGDPRLLRLARSSPYELDLHVLNAGKIFDVEYEELLAAYQAGDKEAIERRQLGKRVRHAANYGMGGLRMAEVALVETEGRLVLDPDECDEWLAKMYAATRGLGEYHAWVRRQMIEDGKLVGSWGRPYYFRGLRLSQEDYKEGYAWLPQHEVGVLTNQGGVLPFDDERRRGRWPGAKLVQQGHDSVVVTTPPSHAWSIARFITEKMGEERTYPGAGGEWTLSMPIGVKLGVTWYGMREWKTLPSREVFEKALQEVKTRQ
jgi:uracil-DNA glycosylase family 4